MTLPEPRPATLAAAVALLGLAGPGPRRQTGGRSTRLEVFPPEINLTTARDRQSIVVQATYADGITRDVTDEATLDPGRPDAGPPRGARPSIPPPTARRPWPSRFGGQIGRRSRSRSRRRAVQPPLSFRLDVMPVFMRSGCNTGSCHGAARGKDGFRLSLFGFDPEGDHFRLTREMSRPAGQPGRPRRQHRCSRRPSAPSSTPAASGSSRQRAVPDARTAGSRPAPPTTTSPSSPRSSASTSTPSRPCSTARGPTQQMHRPGPLLRRHRPRRHPALPSSSPTTTPRPPITPDGLVTAGRPRRGVRDGPVRDPHRRLAGASSCPRA